MVRLMHRLLEESLMTNEESAMAKALDAKHLQIVGTKNGDGTGDPVVVYTNKFRGTEYVHIRSVWQDKSNTWCPGKGLAVSAEGAKGLLEALGKAAAAI
jgi:hypothetical protein